MTIERSIIIEAPPHKVWDVMSDVERWHEWTKSIHNVELLDGPPLRVAGRARVRQPGLPPAVWTVTELEANRGFTWRSDAVGVTSVARHEVTAIADGTGVTLSITWRGPLAWLVALLFGKRSERYVAMEAQGLKTRCESID